MQSDCGGCPERARGRHSGGVPALTIAHLIEIENQIAAGCRFAPDDLTPAEWDGLVALRLSRRPPPQER